MCGIAGIFDPTKAYGETHLKKMTDALSHRGPDGEGFWQEAETQLYFGHRRLSILDLTEAAAQPLQFSDRYILIHNGEIYNYKELRNELLNDGYRFRSESDTEVIAALWDKYGSDAVNHLDGMFAFAIYDRTLKNVYLARDRFGEKPLYFIYNDNTHTLLFASEMKAFKAIGIQLQADPTMVLHFLGTGAVTPAKDAIFYKNIQQVAAGSLVTLELENHLLKKYRYWEHHSTHTQNGGDKDLIQSFHKQFLQSIQMRMRSDVALGTSLSGGLDSASIIAGIHQLEELPASYQHQSFTASFPGFEKDEYAAAQSVCSLYKVRSNRVAPNSTSFAEDLEKLILHHEEPIQSASVYAQYRVFKAAKETGIKVLLDGQGADELLGGYNKYDHWFLQELWKQCQWGLWKKELNALRTANPDLQWNAQNVLAAYFPTLAAWSLKKRTTNKIIQNPWINQDYCRQYFDDSILRKPTIHALNEILSYHSTDVGLPELLRYADKNAMAHGVEVRLPFLQHDMASWLLNLPAHLKIHTGYRKWILRKMIEPFLPNSIVWNRQKIGFEPPQKNWMNTPEIGSMINKAKKVLVDQEILKPEVLDKSSQSHDAYDPKGIEWRILVTGTLLSSQ